MIYGHGDDLYRYGGRVRTNFSSNICQNADLGALKKLQLECLQQGRPLCLEGASVYPD